MSFDGIFTHAISKELNQQLVGGRISKIHQPYTNEIILIIRSQGTNHKLLLSAHPSYARVQLTTIAYQNPTTPPNFCMTLRKYLEGGILETIQQVENDRIIRLTFSKRNELGDLENIVLLIELMGRHSSIVLVNQANNKILDCIKHLGPSQNSYRTLLPGVDYVEPPQAKGQNPFVMSDTEIFHLLSIAEQLNASYLQEHIQGLGKDTAEELVFRLQNQPNQKLTVWHQFLQEIETQIQPMLTTFKQKEYFTPIPYLSLPGKAKTFSSLSILLDTYYIGKAEKDRVKQQGGELIKKMENERKKNKKKRKKLEQSLAETENAEEYRQKGELLTTFMSQIPRGERMIELENYYEEGNKVKISLNPALSPAMNAQKYFQKYQKLKKSVSILHEQLKRTQQEIVYLESVLSQLEFASPSDIEPIREELQQEGYLKRQTKKQAKKQNKSNQPEKFCSSDGDTILVGKNNLQNDQLTLKTAKKTDIWLHAKNIPGSHVVIQNSEPSEQTLIEAANLAAYFSKYRLSASVPVDYVAIKHVHKPNGAKPGYVIYEQQKTLYVTPDEEVVKQLQNRYEEENTH